MSLNRFFYLLLCGIFGLFSQAFAEDLYTPPRIIKKADSEAILIPNLEGIVLVSSKDQLLSGSALSEVHGIELIDLDLPGSPKRLTKDLEPFLNKPLTLETARKIQNKISTFYQDHYHPLVFVEVPTQDISHSVFQFIVTEATVGEIKLEGNQKWSRFHQVRKMIKFQPGDKVNERILVRSLNFLNRSPYRKVDAIYEPGEEEGTSDILFLVHDVRPYQFYIGSDNMGLKNTISTLFYAGFTTGNLFSLGHTLTYQYTTSNFYAMQAHTAQYLAPLPNLHLLNLYGGYATVNPKNTLPGSINNGFMIQASLRYVIPLLPTFSFRQDITAGFDYKRTNTDLIFASDLALTPFHQTVNLTQFMVGYNGSYQHDGYLLSFLAEIYGSPFSWLAQQSNFDYSQLRPGAKHKWIYSRAIFSYFQKLPRGYSLNLIARGQVSSTPLLPSEQFGLGGFETVRGYNERVLNDDDAICLTAELYTPTWKVIQRIRKKSPLSDSLQFLAFIDYGWGDNIKILPGEPKADFLAGVGPGMRYSIQNRFAGRLDYGFKLHKSPVIGTSLGYLHFSAVAYF